MALLRVNHLGSSICVALFVVYAVRRYLQLRPINPCLADAIIYLIFVELAVWVYSVFLTRPQAQNEHAPAPRFALVVHYFPAMCALFMLLPIQAISYCHGSK
jgi:hypothetical protein